VTAPLLASLLAGRDYSLGMVKKKGRRGKEGRRRKKAAL